MWVHTTVSHLIQISRSTICQSMKISSGEDLNPSEARSRKTDIIKNNGLAENRARAKPPLFEPSQQHPTPLTASLRDMTP
jgi:hypothetical protein